MTSTTNSAQTPARRSSAISRLRKSQPLFSNARSIRNAIDRIRLRQANRLVADLDRVLTADNIMSLEASDVLASRVFSKGRPGS